MRIIENGQICSQQPWTFAELRHIRNGLVYVLFAFICATPVRATSMPAARTLTNLDMSNIEQTSALTTGDDGQRLIAITVVLQADCPCARFLQGERDCAAGPALDREPWLLPSPTTFTCVFDPFVAGFQALAQHGG